MIWNSTAVDEGLHVVNTCGPQLLQDFKLLLDSRHGTSRSPEYYDLIAGNWLLHFTHVVYAAQVDVLQGTWSGPSAQTPVPVFADHADYQHTVVTDPGFTEQLRRNVAHWLGGSRFENLRFSQTTCTVGVRPGSAAQRLLRTLKGCVLSMAGPGNAGFVISEPYFKGERSDWLATLWKWRKWARQDDYGYPVQVTVEVDGHWRGERSAQVSGSGFPELVRALLPLYVPVSYLEGHFAYRQRAHALKLRRPKVLYTANSLHHNTLFKTLAADWREEGTMLLNHQHGGGYGMDKASALENYETRVSDRFYTFGWTGASPKQVPLTAALSASQFRISSTAKRILLVCNSYPKHVYRLHYQPMPGTIERMIAATTAFVREMQGIPELVVRPYMSDSWRIADMLRAIDPGLRFDDMRSSGLKSYAASALVVHEVLSTSWLETLAINVPTVCFYDRDTYAFRPQAQPYLDRLAAVGILHESGLSAARFVLGVRSNVQDWWQGNEVQDARLDFVRHYANFSSDWAAHWQAEFRRWLD